METNVSIQTSSLSFFLFHNTFQTGESDQTVYKTIPTMSYAIRYNVLYMLYSYWINIAVKLLFYYASKYLILCVVKHLVTIVSNMLIKYLQKI